MKRISVFGVLDDDQINDSLLSLSTLTYKRQSLKLPSFTYLLRSVVTKARIISYVGRTKSTKYMRISAANERSFLGF